MSAPSRVDVLAAQVRAALYAEPSSSVRADALAALDALVGCVTAAEKRAIAAEISEAATEEILRAERDKAEAALADARNALERIAAWDPMTDGLYGCRNVIACEVLARLDGGQE